MLKGGSRGVTMTAERVRGGEGEAVDEEWD